MSSYLHEQTLAVQRVLDKHQVGESAAEAHSLARELVDAMRGDVNAVARVEYRRFRDQPDGEWSTWTNGSLWECFDDFIHLAGQGIGDSVSQDSEKGYAEIRLWFGGYPRN